MLADRVLAAGEHRFIAAPMGEARVDATREKAF
jgi:hypothetical protein